jgi:hypothetical protein
MDRNEPNNLPAVPKHSSSCTQAQFQLEPHTILAGTTHRSTWSKSKNKLPV